MTKICCIYIDYPLTDISDDEDLSDEESQNIQNEMCDHLIQNKNHLHPKQSGDRPCVFQRVKSYWSALFKHVRCC